jgi:hypothetical protein
VALTNAEKQRNYRQRLKAKQPPAPDFVDHPQLGRMMTLAAALRDCADDPMLRSELLARAEASERAIDEEE